MRITRQDIFVFLGLTCYWPLFRKSWNDPLWVQGTTEATEVWGAYYLFVAATVAVTALAFLARRALDRSLPTCQTVVLGGSLLLAILGCLLGFIPLDPLLAQTVRLSHAALMGTMFVGLTFLWGAQAQRLANQSVLTVAFASAAASSLLMLVSAAPAPGSLLGPILLPLASSLFLRGCPPARPSRLSAPASGSETSSGAARNTPTLPWGFIAILALSNFIVALFYGIMPVVDRFTVNSTWLAIRLGSCILPLLMVAVLAVKASRPRATLLRLWIALSLALLLAMFAAVILPARFIGLSKSLVLADQYCINVFLWGMLVVLCKRRHLSPVAVLPALYATLLAASGCIANLVGPGIASVLPVLGESSFVAVTALLTFVLVLLLLLPLAQAAVKADGTPGASTDDNEPPVELRLVDTFGLSAREADVAALVARGYSVPGIADELHISTHTVQSHMKSIYRKMDVHKKQELIKAVEQLNGHAPEVR